MSEPYWIRLNKETRRLEIVADGFVVMELTFWQALAHSAEVLRQARELGPEPLPFERTLEFKKPTF